MKIASLFAGCGGFDLGFSGGFKHLGVEYENLPFEVVWANDIDSDAIETYRANSKYFGSHPVVQKDIREVRTEDVPDFDILLAGFPCQPFSNAGNRKGVTEERGTLFEEVERFVKDKKPIAFVLENVKGILSSKMADGTPVTEEIRKRLQSFTDGEGNLVEYQIPKAKLLKSNKFGVPQQRQRVFIIGIRKDVSSFEGFNFDNLYSQTKKESLSKVKVKHVLENLTSDILHQDDIWSLSPQARKMIPYIKRSWKDIPYEVLPDRFKRIRDNMKKYRSPNFYRRFSLDEINGTITASAQPENCGILHPFKDRRYSVREIARIQSFPDDFIFPSRNMNNKYKVIGNAVPPVLAHIIAKTLLNHIHISLEKNDTEIEEVLAVY
jgi:DNA (cytosine-5)-methyltransferase 1